MKPGVTAESPAQLNYNSFFLFTYTANWGKLYHSYIITAHCIFVYFLGVNEKTANIM